MTETTSEDSDRVIPHLRIQVTSRGLFHDWDQGGGVRLGGGS